jgi:hypothetical protein
LENVSLLLPLLWLAMCGPAQAAESTVGAQDEAARWTAAKFGGDEESPPEATPGRRPLTTEPPFSFTYDGKAFRDLWFEPERVGDPDSWLGKNHPEWLLPGTSHGALLDEGNPAARQWLTEHVMLADYYPLTPYSRELNRWIAWQFSRPEQGDGVIQAFRRPQSAEEAARYKLRGLDPQARYAVTDLDTGRAQTLTGRELMDDGLHVVIKAQPGAVVLTYTQLK